MSNSVAFQQLTLLTKEFMVRKGIEDYELVLKGDSEKGGNYLSDVTFFRVVTKGEGKTYNLLMKAAKKFENAEQTLPFEGIFQRECFMYQVVFNEMRKLLISAGNYVQLDYVPKIYSVCDEIGNEALIMENLHHLGYRLWDRKKPMDIKHVLLVLENIAKHHGICLAMKKKLPKVFEDITRNLTNTCIEFFQSEDKKMFFDSMIGKACELLEESNRNDLAEKVVKKIKENFTGIMCHETPIEDKLVICHGDCWNNNILFKYEDSDHVHPTRLYLVDFQLSMLDSPVKDVSFFLYTACDKSVLDNFEFLLQSYYASLTATLEKLGCDPSDLFTYKQLMDHWNKYGACGPISSLFFLRIEQVCKEEVPDLDAGDDFDDIFRRVIKNEKEYKRRVLDVFTHFAENFL